MKLAKHQKEVKKGIPFIKTFTIDLVFTINTQNIFCKKKKSASIFFTKKKGGIGGRGKYAFDKWLTTLTKEMLPCLSLKQTNKHPDPAASLEVS